MSNEVLRRLIAGAFTMHGVGHSLGFGRPARCCLLPRASEKTLRVVSSLFDVQVFQEVGRIG